MLSSFMYTCSIVNDKMCNIPFADLDSTADGQFNFRPSTSSSYSFTFTNYPFYSADEEYKNKRPEPLGLILEQTYHS